MCLDRKTDRETDAFLNAFPIQTSYFKPISGLKK